MYNNYNISYNGQNFTDHPVSADSHSFTSLGNIENKVLAVGCGGSDNNKVETFDINSNAWTTETTFPFCSNR